MPFIDDPITTQQREEFARNRAASNKKQQRAEEREALVKGLEPLTIAVSELLIQEQFYARGGASVTEDLHELARFIAYGLVYEPDFASYCNFVAVSPQVNRVISRIRRAMLRIWADTSAQARIFPIWASHRNNPEPMLPTVTYGLYNWVARQSHTLEDLLPGSPKEVPLGVT